MPRRTWRDLDLKDRLRLILNLLMYGAGVSALVWCGVWFVGFFTLSLIIGSFGMSTNTSAFIITLTVLLGHLPKFVAMFLGTDTDFQNLRSILSKSNFESIPYWRLLLTAGLITYLVAVELPAAYPELSNSFDSLELLELWQSTKQNIKMCVLLFLIQAVFSFPTDFSIPSGSNLPGANR